jgi:hypothetical protein
MLDLMKDIGVDGIKLHSLRSDPYLRRRVRVRGGFTFNYRSEILNDSELEDLVRRAKFSAKGKGVAFVATIDFWSPGGNGDAPICSDPWKIVQVVEKGIAACVFSRERPIARWSERGDRPLHKFLADVWNSGPYRELRGALASGKLGRTCLASENCPIVRRRREKA